MAEEDSFMDAMGRLKAGDQLAARQVFERFVDRMLALARSRLDPKLRRKVDPEDIVQSAFKNFYARNVDQPYSLDGWDALWDLLATITVNKCTQQARHFHSSKRDLSLEESTFRSKDDSQRVHEAIAEDPTPDEAAAFDELIMKLVLDLDERDQVIFLLALQGAKTPEIATEIKCSERTVTRVLDILRIRLESIRDRG
jgi:RNA polymerase sigma-70 factor (ECF subfamily)